jgi:hypothetical protein
MRSLLLHPSALLAMFRPVRPLAVRAAVAHRPAAAAQPQLLLPAAAPAADSARCWRWGRRPAAPVGRLWCRPTPAAAGRNGCD